MHWSDRAKRKMDEKGWGPVDLHRATGIPLSQLRKQLAGQVDQPRGNVLQKIAEALEMPLISLRDGLPAPIMQEDPALPGTDVSLINRSMPTRSDMELNVPVFGIAVGGAIGDFQFNGETVDYVRRPPALHHVKSSFAIIVHGDSMSPAFEPGDLAYINPTRPARAGDFVIVECKGNGDGEPGPAFLKRLVRQNGSTLVLQQYNPAKSDIFIETKRIRNIFRVAPWKELMGV